MLTRTRAAAPVNGQRHGETLFPPPNFIARRWNWLLVVPVLLLATLLTVPNLDGAFWVDEVITVQRAGSPINGGPFSPAQIWEHTATTSYDQVPGYYLLMGLWDNLLGWSEVSTRLFSMMAGLLAVALVYRIGRAMHSPLAGLGAATALAVSEHMIKFMHEGRTYALLVLLAALAIWCYWRLIHGHRSWRVMGGLLLASAGLLYAHYFAALLVFSICLYHLFFVRKDREWWRLVIIMGIAGALFLPWVLPNFDAVAGANSEQWRQDMGMTFPELADEVLTFFGNGSLAMLLMIGVFAADIRQRSNRLLWFLLLAPVGLGLLVNLWIGMLVSSKFYLYLWVPLALLFGIGLARIARRGLHPAYILLPWLIAGTWVVVNAQEDPIKYVAWDVLHNELAGQTTNDDSLIFHLQATDWDGAHTRATLYYFHDFPKPPDLVWSWPHAADDVYLNGVRSAIEGVGRVWSSYDPRHRPARVGTLFEPVMRANDFANCGRVVQDDLMWVDLFTRPPVDDFSYRFGSEQYAEGIRMTLRSQISHMPNGNLLIPLGWQIGEEVPLNTYSYALHVLDVDGALVTQSDHGLPPSYDYGCQALQINTDDLPAGDYHLSLVVYAWESGERLDALNTDDNSSGEKIDLGSFHVD